MSRILFSIHAGDSIAHILRTRMLAAGLIAAGHEVLYSVPPGRAQHVQGYVHTVGVSAQKYSFASVTSSHALELALLQHAAAERQVVQDWEPDLIIGDTGAVVHAYAPTAPMLRIIDRFYAEIADDSRSVYSPAQKQILREQVEQAINNVRGKLGISTRFDYADFVGPPTAIDGASFLVDDLPAIYRRVGSNVALRAPRSLLEPHEDTCFFTLGTGLDESRVQIFRKLLERLRNRFGRIYVAYGTKLNRNDLDIPDDGAVIAQARFESVPKDVGVMVCHCGTSMMHLGVALKVPIIAVPLHVEQFSNAFHLERLGFGVNVTSLPPGQFEGIMCRPIVDEERLQHALEAPRSCRSEYELCDRFPEDGSLLWQLVGDLL